MSDSQFKRERSRSPIGSHRSLSPDNRPKFRDPKETVYSLFVANIPAVWTHWNIKHYLKSKLQSKVLAEDLRFVKVLKNKDGNPTGKCVVEFGDLHNAIDAMTQLDGISCGDNKLIVKQDNKSHHIKNLGDKEHRSRFQVSYSAGKMEEDNNNMNCNLYGLSMDFIQSLGIKPPLSNRIFIVNLDFKVDEEKLREIFSLAGQVVSVNLHKDKNGTSKGLAQVEYDHPVEAVQAISMFNMQTLYDRVLSVRFDIKSPGKTLLPEGLKAVGHGLGVNGAPLRGVRNFVELQPLKKVLKRLESTNVSNNESNVQQRPQDNMNVSNQVMSNAMSNPLLNMTNMTNMTNPASMMNVVGMSNPTMGMDLQQNSAESMTAWLPQVQLTTNTVQPNVWTMNQSNSAAGLNQMVTGNVNTQNLQLLQALVQAQSSTQNIAAITGLGNQSVMQNMMGFSQMQGNLNQPSVKAAVEDTNSNTDNSNFVQSTMKMDNVQEQHRSMSDMVVISNLPPSVTLSILRDKMREVGEIRMAEMTGQDTAIVRFTNSWDAERCVKIFDRSRVDGQTIEVRCI